MNQIFAIGKEQVEISIPDENVMAVLHANLPDIKLSNLIKYTKKHFRDDRMFPTIE